LLLYRRNQIDATRLRTGLRQSDVRDEWYNELLDLRYLPMSVGEVITAALKHHLDPATARTYLGFAGMDPAHFDTLLASAGRPLGLEEMLHLLNRGKMTEAQVRQGIAQSDVNDDYTDFALELRHYFPPPRSIVPMLRSEAITEAQARQLLTYYGVGEPWASAFITEAHHTSSSGVKEVTQANVVSMYVDRFLTRAEALARLEKLKYSPGDATLLLDFADEKRHAQLITSAARAIGSRYVGYRITRTEAQDALTRAEVPVNAAADMLHLWDIEREANQLDVSPSQIVGALRRGLITPAQAHDRLLARGVAPADLAVVVVDGWPPTSAAEGRAAAQAVVNRAAQLPGTPGGTSSTGKAPTTTQIRDEYLGNVLTRAQTLAALASIGYSATDAENLVRLWDTQKAPAP
jgi:hypothetical protein